MRELREAHSSAARDVLKVKQFVEECFKLCWCMVVQDPPVVFASVARHGERFDKNMYTAYTQSGSVIEFAVWPPLLLCEDGAVLRKGVTQCMPGEIRRPVSAYTSMTERHNEYSRPASCHGTTNKYSRPASSHGTTNENSRPASSHGTTNEYSRPASSHGTSNEYSRPASSHGTTNEYPRSASSRGTTNEYPRLASSNGSYLTYHNNWTDVREDTNRHNDRTSIHTSDGRSKYLYGKAACDYSDYAISGMNSTQGSYTQSTVSVRRPETRNSPYKFNFNR